MGKSFLFFSPIWVKAFCPHIARYTLTSLYHQCNYKGNITTSKENMDKMINTEKFKKRKKGSHSIECVSTMRI